MRPEHLRATTWHKRHGGPANAFSYGVDYLLLAPENIRQTPVLFSHNRPNLFAWYDRDYGGERGQGRGAAWVREVLAEAGLDAGQDLSIRLLAQPRMLGTKFSPVSFWLITGPDGALLAAIAEVNNTFGERHNYLCHKPGFAPITAADEISAQKLFHVSPFQPRAGVYRFRFDVSDQSLHIRIHFQHATGGLTATLGGDRRPLRSAGILAALIRRPFGAVRVLALIHFQALKLFAKRAVFYRHPPPDPNTVSQ